LRDAGTGHRVNRLTGGVRNQMEMEALHAIFRQLDCGYRQDSADKPDFIPDPSNLPRSADSVLVRISPHGQFRPVARKNGGIPELRSFTHSIPNLLIPAIVTLRPAKASRYPESAHSFLMLSKIAARIGRNPGSSGIPAIHSDSPPPHL
jgi:hypothetical protein